MVREMIFSFPRLKLYQACPYRFRLKYIEGRKEPVTKPLALGKAVHKAIERIIAGDRQKEAVLKGMIEADFHPEVTAEEIEQLLKNAPIRQGMGQTEVHFQIALSDSPGSPIIQGYIDLIDENDISDWKTNWKPYDVLDNYQVGLYAYAIQQLKGFDEVKGRLFFLRYRKPSQHTFDRSDTEKARKWAYDTAQEINSKLFLHEIMPEKVDKIFPATPSPECHHCPFVIECYRKFGMKTA